MQDSKVAVRLGATKKLGPEYGEFIRLDFEVEAPVNQGERVSDAVDRVYALVEKKLQDKLTELLED